MWVALLANKVEFLWISWEKHWNLSFPAQFPCASPLTYRFTPMNQSSIMCQNHLFSTGFGQIFAIKSKSAQSKTVAIRVCRLSFSQQFPFGISALNCPLNWCFSSKNTWTNFIFFACIETPSVFSIFSILLHETSHFGIL